MNTKTENTRPGWGLVVFYLLAFLCVVTAFFADERISAWLADHSSKGLRETMTWVSKVGDWPEHVALGLILLGGAWLKRSRTWQRIFLAMLIACATAGVAARVIKITVARPRPSVHTQLTATADRLHAKYQSFPSGHTAASTAFFATLLLFRRRLGALFLFVPALIAASRLIVGAHYLSDVTFAAVLGVVCAVIVRRFFTATEEVPPPPLTA